MASPFVQTIHLIHPEQCSNCGHAQIVRTSNEAVIASGTVGHRNPAGKDDSNCTSRQLHANTAMAVYVANLLLIGGAIAISIMPSSASSPLIFGGFLLGHVCLSMHAVRSCERGLLFLNAALATLDFYAVIIRF